MTDVVEPDASTAAIDRPAAIAPFELHCRRAAPGGPRRPRRRDRRALARRDADPALDRAGAARRGARVGAVFRSLPYSNRLGYRRFAGAASDHTTRANVADSPHSLARRSAGSAPWADRLVERARARARAAPRGDADWPFAFTARQYLALDAASFSARLQLSNDADVEQPVGLGWQPCTSSSGSRSRMHIELSHRWDADATAAADAQGRAARHRQRRVAPRLRQLLRRLARPGADPRRALLAAARVVAALSRRRTRRKSTTTSRVEPVSHV